MDKENKNIEVDKSQQIWVDCHLRSDDNFYSSNPKDHNKTSFDTWDEMFDFQSRKDYANYTLLKEWLKKFCEVPNLKEE